MKEDASQVGQYLQYEREKKGISIEEIASQLKLSVTALKNLEQANFDELPGAIYIRGYIRAYCSVIEIDPTSVLQLFSEQTDTTSQPKPRDQIVAPVVNERIQYVTRVWGTVLIVAVIVFALMDRWSERAEEPPLQVQIAPQETTQQQIDPMIDLKSAEDPKPYSSESDATEQATQQGTKQATEQAAQTPAIGGSTVYMTVITEGSSWVRIYTNEADIVRRLLPDSYRKSFNVKLPIHIELGDSRHVQIWFNGKRYDFTRYVSDIYTAFFSLEELPKSE